MNSNENLSELKIGMLNFPGTNCSADTVNVFKRYFDIDIIDIWHTDTSFPEIDALVIPGGFSFGDYLRAGALASHSPVIKNVKKYANIGGAILGICNGFQILTMTSLLPGVLLLNENRKFVCRHVILKAHADISTAKITLPVAHAQGRYYIDSKSLQHLQQQDQIILEYVNKDSNVNGSTANIAGIRGYGKYKKIWGMMPHPERAVDNYLNISETNNEDGLLVIQKFLKGI